MRRAQTAEVPALHGAGKALTDGDARDVYLLAGDKVVSADFGADRQKVVLGDAKFAHDRLWLDLGAGKLAALGCGLAFRLSSARRENDGVIAIAFRLTRRRLGLFVLTRFFRLQLDRFARGVLECFGVDSAAADNLTTCEIKNRDGRVRAVFTENAHHADLARDDASTTGGFFAHRDQPRTWICTSTPADRSSFISASTVCGVG